MMKDYFVAAILALRPGSEFAFINNDYSTIDWHKLEGKAPTLIEIQAKMDELIAADEAFEAERARAKAALLARLGLTEDEAKLLVS
jgi:hypothetical protein